MQSQDNDPDVSQNQWDTIYQHDSYQLEVASQDEPSQPMGIGTARPTYWQDCPPAPSDVVWDPRGFLLGHIEPYNQRNELSVQSYSPLYPPYVLPEGSLLSGIGGIVNSAVPVGYGLPYQNTWAGGEDPGYFPRCGTGPGGPMHLTTNIRMASPQLLHPIERSPTRMSSDSSSLLNALGLDPLRGERPQSTEEDFQYEDSYIDPAGKDVVIHESKTEKDKKRQRKRRREEDVHWQELEDIFGKEATRYDRLYMAGVLLRIPVPKKKNAPRKRSVGNRPCTREERNIRKNASGKRDTKMMAIATRVIAKHFEMEGAKRRDVLARLVDEVRLGMM